MSIPVALIDSTFFEKHPVWLSLDEFSGAEHLENIILTYQDEVCRMILGDIEYNNFVSDFTLGVPVTQKWLDFLNGKTYQVDSKNVIWNGFKHLLKHFIFYYYLRDVETLTTQISNVKPNTKNSTPVSYAKKMAQVWNLGHKYYGVDYKFKFDNYFKSLTFTNVDIFRYDLNFYNNFRFKCYDETIEKYKPTVYNFLYNNSTDFPDWKFTQIGILNSIGF